MLLECRSGKRRALMECELTFCWLSFSVSICLLVFAILIARYPSRDVFLT
jgi:hypothetical protein